MRMFLYVPTESLPTKRSDQAFTNWLYSFDLTSSHSFLWLCYLLYLTCKYTYINTRTYNDILYTDIQVIFNSECGSTSYLHSLVSSTKVFWVLSICKKDLYKVENFLEYKMPQKCTVNIYTIIFVQL